MQIHDLFVLEWPNKCLIEQFVILNPDGSEVSLYDSLYDRLDLSNRDSNVLMFNTNIKMTDGSVVAQTFDFKIKAISKGGAFLTKDISVSVTICGSEIITPAVDSTFKKSLGIDPEA